MADVFIYMFFVGLGLSVGIGTTTFIGWKIVKRSNKKEAAKRKSIV
ncbi:hypothetical protein ACNQFZ_06585 [Schinkia sp. CFF1]